MDGKGLRWGHPPLALVPVALSGRLAGLPLPQWVADLLDGPGTALSALTADAWSRLPREEPARRRIRRVVASQVHAFAFELRDVPVGAPTGGPADDEPAGGEPAGGGPAGGGHGSAAPPCRGPAPRRARRSHWTLRARAALGGVVGWCGDQGGPLTFGALLDVPGSGVVAALEVAALLELDGEAAPDGAPAGALPILRWGYPGCALLPRSLRHALDGETLPPAVAGDLGLPPGATVRTLDDSVWLHADGMSRRAEEHLLGLVDAQPVQRLRVMDDAWPAARRPEDVPWPRRLRGGLQRAGLLDPERLHRVTYGDLLGLPAVGRKSAIEFGVIADAVSADDETREGPADRHALLAAAAEPWTDRIRADDARFADVIPPYGTTLRAMLRHAADRPEGRPARVLARSIAAARARAEEIATEPLDRAVPRLGAALGISQRDLDVTADRLGWRRGCTATLREVGARYGITRERVRQLVDRTTTTMDGAYLPQVEQAAALLAGCAPMTGADAALLLADEGFNGEPLDPWSVLSLAEATGYGAAFRVDDSSGTRLVLPIGPVDARTVLRAARRATGRAGVARLCQVPTAVTGRNPAALPLPVVTLVLRNAPGVAFLDDEWFWLPGTPPDRNYLRTTTRRMLSVAGRLDLATIRHGLARYQRQPLHHVAPVPVLAAFYRDHPDFVLRGDVVESAAPLDLRRALSPGEQALVQALREAPGGLLSRSALQQAVAGRGVNADAFAALVATTPVLGHRGHDAWCLRGGSTARSPAGQPTGRPTGPPAGPCAGPATGPS